MSRDKLDRLGAAAGVHPVLLPDDDPVAAALTATAGEGLDAVLVTSAAPGVLDQATAMARPGGTLVLVALPGAPRMIDVDACVVRELSLHGSYAYEDRDFADAAATRNPAEGLAGYGRSAALIAVPRAMASSAAAHSSSANGKTMRSAGTTAVDSKSSAVR